MSRPITKVTLLVVTTLALLGTISVGVADNWNEFYQFRHSSALPGNLFAVSAEGQVGFDGALLQNVPVAYTPCGGNWVLGGNCGSTSHSVEVDWGGPDVNGTAFLGIGFGKPGHGVYISDIETGDDWASAYNIQVQVMAESFERPALAVGIQDVLNQRERVVGQPHGALSPYVVITGRIGPPEQPMYMSLGWGGGRFGSSPIGGLSMPASDQLTVVAEYDGFNTNAGVAYSLHSRRAQRDWGIIGYFGLSDLERPIVGFTFTKH